MFIGTSTQITDCRTKILHRKSRDNTSPNLTFPNLTFPPFPTYHVTWSRFISNPRSDGIPFWVDVSLSEGTSPTEKWHPLRLFCVLFTSFFFVCLSKWLRQVGEERQIAQRTYRLCRFCRLCLLSQELWVQYQSEGNFEVVYVPYHAGEHWALPLFNHRPVTDCIRRRSCVYIAVYSFYVFLGRSRNRLFPQVVPQLPLFGKYFFPFPLHHVIWSRFILYPQLMGSHTLLIF